MRTRGVKAAVLPVNNPCRPVNEGDVAEQCSEADLLQQYSSIKQLISKNSYAAALQQGWTLLQRVKSITTGAERKSRCMQELYVAASLNVVLCSAHVRMPPAIDLAAVNTATWGLVEELRQQPKSAAAPHAGLLYKCLLKITLSVGQQVSQRSPLGSTSELHNNMQELMVSLVAAADLCGQPGLPQQVALKACQQLPPSLQHCMLLALAQAVDAQLLPLTAQGSTTSSQSTLVSAPLAALCLQHLASSLQFDISCIETCVSVLADALEQSAQQATVCLLMTALCRGREAELAASTITQLAAAAHTVAQCLQQHAIQVLSCDPPTCSRSSTTSSRSSSSSSQGAAHAEPRHGGSATTAADLQLGVLRLQQWCIESAALSGPELLGPSCPLITSTACTAVTALCARGQQLGTAKELAAKVVAGAAACLSRCWAQEQQHQSSQRKRGAAAAIAPSTCDLGDRGRACCDHQAGGPDQQCHFGVGTARQPLQQLSMAVQQLVAWQDLQQHLCGISTAGMTAGGKQQLPAPASVYTWLAQKLHKAALAAASTWEVAAEPSRSSIDNPVAAGLSLMALQCSCAAAVAAAAAAEPADGGGDSSSDLSAAASPEQQVELSAAALAVKNVLQLAKPVLRCAAAHATMSEGSSAAGDTPVAAGMVGRCMAAAAAGCCRVPCSHEVVQEALLLGACLMGRLPNWEQQQLEPQWYSTLRSYSRLRCALATAKEDSPPPVRSASDSCGSAMTGSKARGRRAGGKAAAPAQNEQPTLQPSGLHPDSHQCGMRQQQEQLAPLAQLASGTAGGLQYPRLDRLYCLEGASLCQVHALAASSGTPVAAAALSLLQDLAEDAARAGSGRGKLQEAQLLTARGMLLLQLAARQPDDAPACCADPAGQAQSVLLKACQLYGTALQHTPAGSDIQNGRAAAATSTASKGRSKGAASNSSRKAADLKQKQQPQSHTGCSTSRCPAEECLEGDSSQADTLASAALCHCVVGVVMAQSVQQGHNAAADKQEVSLNPAADPEAGTEELGGAGTRARGARTSAMPYDAALWFEVAHHLQQSCALFRHCIALLDCTSSSSSGASSVVLRYHEEAAAVVMQAWHIAALQGWWELQHTFADALAFVSGAATQHVRQHLFAPLQVLQLSSGADWLALLMQPQVLVQEQHTCSSVSASADADADSAVASSPKSQREQQPGDVQDVLQDDGCQGREQLDSRGWPGLQHIQQQLAASRMAMNAGNTARAAAAAELALQHCRTLLKEAGSNTSSTCPRTATSAMDVAAASRACVHWHGLGLYMSGIWQLAGIADAAGHPQDAVRMLKELHKLSCSCCCLSFAALAQASISRVYTRWGRHAEAATAAAAAEALLQCMDQNQQQQQQPPQPSAVHALIVAAVAAAAAAIAMNDGQYRNAHEQLCAAVTALQDRQGCAGSQQLVWVLVDQQAQLLLQQARCHVLLQEPDLAVAALQQAAGVLEAAGSPGQNRGPGGVWPVTWAAVQLQLLSLNRPAQGLPHTCTGAGSLALAGFRSGTHSNDLLAEFASAANTGPGRGHPEGQATASSRGSSTSSRSSRMDVRKPARQRAANRGAGAAGREADPSKLAGTTRRNKAPRRPSSSEGEGDLGGDASSVRPTAGAARGSNTANDSSEPAEPVSWLCSMLQVMPLIAQQPLLLKEACSVLYSTFAEYDAVHAAAMFQQMSSGASITQQQLNMATSMLCHGQLEQHAQQPRDQQSKTPCPGQPADSHWQQLQVLLSHTSVLQLVADAAQHAVSAADPGTVLQGLVSAVDSAAAQWLRSKLEKLPPGTAVCSISRQHASGGAGGLFVQQQEHHAASTAADTLHGDGLAVSRVMLDGSGKLAVPLLVQLPRPSAIASQQDAGVYALLDDLHSVLADASATMADSSSCLDTTAGKARWWKQRLDQDKRMAGVLQQLDQQWLGPWKCLLMQPGLPAVEAAAAAASQAFVAEQFDCVLDERACQLLSQLVVLLLVHFNALTTAELASALQDLSNLSQQRVDGFHLQQLLSELEAAHATASKAAAGMQETAAAGSCIGAPGSALRGSPAASRKPCVSAAAAAGATAAQLTPLDGAATARRPGARSRGRALQAAQGMSAAGADTTCKAAAASGEAPAMQVPQSIARHASRRSRLRVMHDSPSSSRHQARAASRLPPVGRQAVLEAGPGCFDGCAAACSTPAPSRAGKAGCFSAVSTAVAAEQDCGERQGPNSSDSGGASSIAGPVQAAADTRGRGSMQWRPAVVLVLDDSTQQLPWESCQGLKGQSIYRCPGLAYAAGLSARIQVAAPQGADQLLRLSRSFYLLNPDGDLAATQQTLQETLEQMCHKGVAGSRPAANHLMAALQQHDLFLYFGHGAAEQCLPLSALRRLDSCAAALLMGCSSGRLRSAGQYEAAGPVWSYLMAGCPATVANLWDVTDRDIDRFATSLLQSWADGSSDSATGGADTSSCTNKHTGSVAAAVVGGSSEDTCGARDVSISVSVSSSRQACRLPHLIGSAAVCYGLPNCTIGH